MAEDHQWITGASRAACLTAAAAYGPAVSADCHRRLRGPYTGAGTIMRALVPRIHQRDRALAARHAIEILAVAPELEQLIGPAPETLASIAPPGERTRWYSRYRTRRIAHGLVDFLRQCAAGGPLTIYFGSADEADPTDVEFLSIALRRLDPAQVRIIVGSRGEIPGLAAELTARTRRAQAGASTGDLAGVPGPGPAAAPGPPGASGGPDQDLIAFVASDGTSDIPAELAAYRHADPAVRARLHDERAAELERGGEWSQRLGAIPYHREHGSSPVTTGQKAFAEAVNYCIGMAYYAAGLDLATRLARLMDADAEPKLYYRVRGQMCQCLALLDRPEETEPIYYDLMARSASPMRHMTVSYSLAMCYTRLYAPERKDHRRALAHVNTAIAIASQLEDPDERAFNTVFMNNGKALVELHLGNLAASLELVETGIRRLDRELAPGQHLLQRSVMHHNRAQLLAALERPADALADYEHVISVDPYYPEYRFDRGNLYSKLGRYTEALADYEAARQLTPPYPELYYNMGDARAALGDLDGAVGDFRYALDLEPDDLEARITLASVLMDLGQPEDAAAEARAGLAFAPLEGRLHVTLGLALLEQSEYQAARQSFDRALELDPGLSEALVNRAVAAYEEGLFESAIADLIAALTADPGNPDLLQNLAVAQEAAGHPAVAAADSTAALRHP